jgi:hypothetical protein
MGDQIILTFPSCANAFRAVGDLADAAREYEIGSDRIQKISFVVGADFGDLYIYRNAIFGPSSNRAQFCAEEAAHIIEDIDGSPSFCFVLTGSAKSKCDGDIQVQVNPIDDSKRQLRRRMNNRKIDSLWMICDQ